MIIANPLYDTAFKGLIGDKEVAKALIGTLLETEIIKVEPRVTEHIKPLEEDDRRPRCLRLDYAALIKNEKGEEQKILIEVQKATGADNIMRFRQYLAVAGYMKKEEEESPLPIVTIYFLGFKLDNVPTPCLKVARQYVDMLENKVLETREKFIELLTHDSFIIQTPRINMSGNPKTELENILSVFEQKGFVGTEETIINYKYPVEGDYLKKMVDILHYIGTDPEERKKMDEEAYWYRHDENTVGKLLKAQEELKEKGKELKEKGKELKEKDKKLEKMRQENKEIAVKSKIEGKFEGEKQKAIEIAKELKHDKMPVEKISKLTGLAMNEIEKL